MEGEDSLGGGTSTHVVSQRSEGGQGILVVKAGRGKYDMLYVVVCKAAMSLSAGCFSSAELRGTLSCLAITTILSEGVGGQRYLAFLLARVKASVMLLINNLVYVMCLATTLEI
jgi:hypothetical protein